MIHHHNQVLYKLKPEDFKQEEEAAILMQNEYSGRNRVDHWGIQFDKGGLKGAILQWWYNDNTCECNDAK